MHCTLFPDAADRILEKRKPHLIETFQCTNKRESKCTQNETETNWDKDNWDRDRDQHSSRQSRLRHSRPHQNLDHMFAVCFAAKSSNWDHGWDHWHCQDHQGHSSKPFIETIETETTHQDDSSKVRQNAKTSPKVWFSLFENSFCVSLANRRCNTGMCSIPFTCSSGKRHTRHAYYSELLHCKVVFSPLLVAIVVKDMRIVIVI